MDGRGVELSVNVHAADVSFVEATYRHLVGQLDYRFARRRIVVDRSDAEGRFVTPDADQRLLDAILSTLLEDDVVDAVDDVDWSQDECTRISQRWFGHRNAPTRSDGGSALHQYLWALDTAEAPYVLHLDDDMLMHVEDDCRWIDDGIDMMRTNPDVVMVSPAAGPPLARNWRGVVLGRRTVTAPTESWYAASGVSTRIFLVDRAKLLGALPLQPARPSDPLETMLGDTFATAGLKRLGRHDHRTYVLHPRRHNRNHTRYLAELIEMVEAGDVPFRRTGNSWDLRTEGRHFWPWWLRIQRRRLRARLP